jgi:D-glycero-D-manno-heptose 1,7-bisphosphate phosphatase
MSGWVRPTDSSRWLAPDGIWGRVYRQRNGPRPLPALFLDRDGVIVEEVHYLHRPADVRLLPGAATAITAANDCGVPVVVVTNQAGIGRGYYDWSAFAAVLDTMTAMLAKEGAAIDAVFACPFHRDALPPYDHADHPGRKPGPGMLQRAAGQLNLDLRRSWIVGDTLADILAGRAAGLAGGAHVLTGYGRRDREAVLALDNGRYRVLLAEDLAQATSLVPLLAAQSEPLTDGPTPGSRVARTAPGL